MDKLLRNGKPFTEVTEWAQRHATKQSVREFGTSAAEDIITRYLQIAVPVALPAEDGSVWAIETPINLIRVRGFEHISHTQYAYNCVSDFEEPKPAPNPTK